MSSLPHGSTISSKKAILLSEGGFSIKWRDRELRISFDRFPWFKTESAAVLDDWQEVSPGHFYWPQLDVDLTADMIEHPDRFPNVAKWKRG